MKTKRQKFLSREQVEKQFQKHVGAIRKIHGFQNLAIKVRVRIQDADPNKAVELQSAHSV